ncbi:DNA/RNA nuclease SfsA [Clostridium luticellarii]|uniref:Sugar fermentation stimulation protein homolog n=1 Tax=Clostridium luticellarii TaxID=1691940 RepID=A0A2T0BLW1_9CLOT|nr:DNA/RNA nuclease SfsA [Clostridium luticellarii]MCI1945916.1 DNA/RNA nuclease SfsA [Clostridium luticellarii]MCI1969278.1 DNA/RNA nuclease SfsA [Clostridium luticellarii]MCI1996202.1 DNA/RNA nuclease SfsA [Clostridium luticellarii]MCI2040581.1 DNA/RNA nuclease SfsA [Clostridium luticellarii]PRR84880.1 Sugar fermentation stimulation protein A [Clostridium luticellarii]
MIFDKKVVRAEFISRPNRFQAYVNMNNSELMIHVPNTGRCREILVPGTTVILREENSPKRKTRYDLIAGYKGSRLINIDSQIPNKVVAEALICKKINYFKKYTKIEREKTFGNSRFDFKLCDEEGNECYLEVKGVTLEENGVSMFPDAPTERGRKHLLELVNVRNTGLDAAVLFLIQMKEVKYFTPYDKMDKEFGKALRYAWQNNVKIFAYDCNVGENFITLKDQVSVKL